MKIDIKLMLLSIILALLLACVPRYQQKTGRIAGDNNIPVRSGYDGK